MGVVLNYAGGVVTATGYPATAGGLQTDQVGTVSVDPSFSVLDYGTLTTSPGDSGAPLWLDFNGSDQVAGIVSTGLWAAQLTTADWNQIESWVSQDGYTLAANASPVVTAVPSVSLAAGQSILASSLIASVSDPTSDAIAYNVFEDLGGGSGYFTVNGVRQPNGVWISAFPGVTVKYVAGASPGSDTLGVGIHDGTTNSNITTSVVATSTHTAPVVTVVPSVSIGEGQSISASSLIVSISNPSGDDYRERHLREPRGRKRLFHRQRSEATGWRMDFRGPIGQRPICRRILARERHARGGNPRRDHQQQHLNLRRCYDAIRRAGGDRRFEHIA